MLALQRPGNVLRILAAVRQTRPDVVLFNIQFASFGSGKISGALGLTAPRWSRSPDTPPSRCSTTSWRR